MEATMHRALYLAGFGYLAVCGAIVWRHQARSDVAVPPETPIASGSSGAQWLAAIRPFCNSVEVELAQRHRPAPPGVEGQGYGAACYALAGKMDSARAVIDRLDPPQRYQAAGIVFDVAHPVADAGDDRSAGPIMEMVIEYWPNHYMALYHAGIAEHGLGEFDLARRHLESFLQYYRQDDGWSRNARETLERMAREQ